MNCIFVADHDFAIALSLIAVSRHRFIASSAEKPAGLRGSWESNRIYHLVMTNSSPWKIPKINGGFVRWENHLYMDHGFHGYVKWPDGIRLKYIKVWRGLWFMTLTWRTWKKLEGPVLPDAQLKSAVALIPSSSTLRWNVLEHLELDGRWWSTWDEVVVFR